jgi:hypothetical protein
MILLLGELTDADYHSIMMTFITGYRNRFIEKGMVKVLAIKDSRHHLASGIILI